MQRSVAASSSSSSTPAGARQGRRRPPRLQHVAVVPDLDLLHQHPHRENLFCFPPFSYSFASCGRRMLPSERLAMNAMVACSSSFLWACCRSYLSSWPPLSLQHPTTHQLTQHHRPPIRAREPAALLHLVPVDVCT